MNTNYRQWLKYAEDDFSSAKILLESQLFNNCLRECQQAIKSLPKRDYKRLREWFSEDNWSQWDQQIKTDVKKGKIIFGFG
jgi:hypothetical protein